MPEYLTTRSDAVDGAELETAISTASVTPTRFRTQAIIPRLATMETVKATHTRPANRFLARGRTL